jgi:trans-2,3-dihydro-3-hydroxyanthranilate isomerase
MRRLRYVIVDVFTDVPLQGNQLAVFTDARGLSTEEMQALAREMNFSETTFVLPPTRATPQAESAGRGDALQTDETVFVYPPEADGHVKMRIFTPGTELPFAGHPILGTAFVLAGPLQLVEIRLETGAGVVPVRLEREDARIVFGWMTQPTPSFEPFPERNALLAVLGAEATDLPIELYRQGPGHVMVELGSPEAVAALRPNMGALAELLSGGTNCFARDGKRWKSRVFVPGAGIDEDPATGSAAGPLALHLARHGRIAFGEEIEISQGMEIGRPSTLYAVAHSPERIEVGGSAVIVARGEFRL